jgi:hypothetical protein
LFDSGILLIIDLNKKKGKRGGGGEHVTFIEQKGECIIRYYGRPCDEFTERVWPIKISDDTLSFLLITCRWMIDFMIMSATASIPRVDTTSVYQL